MKESIKIIVSGLDDAGKTSILTALNYKFDFMDHITSLTPTIKVNYLKSDFLNKKVIFWDMGGQEQYRQQYLKKPTVYFDSTDLLIYVIDIQNPDSFDTSLDYLDSILKYFLDDNLIIPVLVAFHKYDPNIITYKEINKKIKTLSAKISQKYPQFRITFQQTTIYDVVSIIQLISYGLSFFDDRYLELSLLIQEYSQIFQSSSLIIFDKSGLIIADYYNDILDTLNTISTINSIKKHLFLIKRSYDEDDEGYKWGMANIIDKNGAQSYIVQITVSEERFYISIFIEKEYMENIDNNIHLFLEELSPLLSSVLI